jgi:hypothetical protein
MPFYHLTQYCRSNTAVDIARILQVSTSPAGIKYKFGIQVPKGIKNAIDLDRKNGNQLRQEAIRTELKQLIDYQTFIVLDSGEDIPTGYQKIPYQMVFDVKYELRHEERLVAVVDKTILIGEAWKNQEIGLALSAKTYNQNVIPKFEGLFGKEFKPIKTPMSEGYHPEVDDSPLCTEDNSDKCRSIIGYCIWIIVLVDLIQHMLLLL